jgi:RNA polymerase II-associated protein 1
VNRKLRFADVTPGDIYVYESAPPSPRRKPLALLPSSKDDLAVSLGEWKRTTPNFAKSASSSESHLEVPSPDKDSSPASSYVIPDGTPEEGTPEDIRRRFFPSLPGGDPSLAWIESTLPLDPQAFTLRFDLHGAPIPPALSATLPTHLGLHHHAEGARAGYTLDDIFLLARSTVPAQRVVMLGVLAGIVRRLASMHRGISRETEGLEELRGREEELRKRAVAAGAEAMSERGSLGSRAVELLWEVLVGWDEELMSVDGVELQEDPPKDVSHDLGGESALNGDTISSLPLQFFLAQIAKIFATADLPHLSLVQLLSVLQRLAIHSNTIADEITDTPSLVPNVLRVFILTPIPPSENSPLPVPAAIHFLTTLASASRVSASKLLDPADSLLRFLTSSPTSSPYPPPLATALLAHTLRLYTTFARYGLYAHIATTAAEPLARLSSYILSFECDSRPLSISYVSLLGAWITCASDPHQTTPPHEILWSQVSGWGWITDLTTVARKLTQEPADFDTWAELWNTEAIWLEGARYNGVRGGASERDTSLAQLRTGFASGTEKEAVQGAMSSLQRLLSEIPTGYDASKGLAFYREISGSALVLSAVIRLWLACFPPDYKPLPEPPFQLPFSRLGMLAMFAVTHPILSELSAIPPHTRPFMRPLISFVTNFVWLSRRHPNTSSSLWLAQLSTAVMRSLPGDEDAARDMLDAILNLVDERYLSECGWSVPSEMWSRGGLHILKPFLAPGLALPTDDANVEGEKAPRVRVAPLFPTPRSLMLTTTQRLPSRSFAFVFARDWPLLPLDHLLRSGTSPVWQQLPADWDGSETDIARATLLLSCVVREALVANGTPTFVMNRAEVTFGCMKVFMLEHGQGQGAPSANGEDREEVFRDTTVSELMEALLRPCRLGASSNGLSASTSLDEQDSLELAAARFLGTGTPFFQFYTDFVTLYDGASFGHQLFAELLLPPLAQHYAPDYRKLLYDDIAHVLGTVRTPVERVIGGAVGTFLWPAEQVQQVVGAQLGLLVGRRARVLVEGFVRWMAVHHVAANIWPDLREDATSLVADERGRSLLQTLVNQGEHGVVREVTLYWQRREADVVLPPVCFDLEPVRRRNRLDWVKFWAKGLLLEHMEGLLGVNG